jgi:hypothetical protein
MILEVDDRGRLERIAVIDGDLDRVVDDRRFIGGYRLNTSGFESVWFDKAIWDATLMPDESGIKTYRLIRKTA